MNDVVIVFGILLAVILVISALGGSVRYSERFEYFSAPPGTPATPVPQVPVKQAPAVAPSPTQADLDAAAKKSKEKFQDPEEDPEKKSGDTVEAFSGGYYAGV